MTVSRPRLTVCVAAFTLAIGIPLVAQTPTPPPPAPLPATPPPATPPPAISGFDTGILAGGAVNTLMLSDVQPTDLAGLPDATITWTPCAAGQPAASSTVRARTKAAGEDNAGTVLTLRIPYPPCARSMLRMSVPWPLYQDATIRVAGVTQAGAPRALFDGTVPVSVRWFALTMTFVVLGSIYPGLAMVAYFLSRRRHSRMPAGIEKDANKPRFLEQLDPVQITANTYGRGSLPKLQIFGFSFIVFGLLVYYQFRNGFLSGLSEDVLFLLGISAVGTVGGRITYAAKRRLSLDNWVWLRRRGWMRSAGEGSGRHAMWRELIVDADSKEFDPYSFQMAIFSIVVAIALVSSSVMGLASFTIPPELLGLLGLSQAVFIAGKAAEDSPFKELDTTLTGIQKHERQYQQARATADATLDATVKAEAEAAATAERAAFKNEASQAADMVLLLFADAFADDVPDALKKACARDIEPEAITQQAAARV